MVTKQISIRDETKLWERKRKETIAKYKVGCGLEPETVADIK